MPRKMVRFLVSLALVFLTWSAVTASPREARELEQILQAMHPEFRNHIRAVRHAPAGAAASDLYLALVRPRGRDPRLPADRPRSGAGRRYDLLVFPGTLGPGVSIAWKRLLADHEYFHARHLARDNGLPQPVFARQAANHHFQEALAWGHGLARLSAGDYGTLPPGRVQEVRQRYREHRQALARYVRKKQPSIWAYYALLLPEQDSSE